MHKLLDSSDMLHHTNCAVGLYTSSSCYVAWSYWSMASFGYRGIRFKCCFVRLLYWSWVIHVLLVKEVYLTQNWLSHRISSLPAMPTNTRPASIDRFVAGFKQLIVCICTGRKVDRTPQIATRITPYPKQHSWADGPMHASSVLIAICVQGKEYTPGNVSTTMLIDPRLCWRQTHLRSSCRKHPLQWQMWAGTYGYAREHGIGMRSYL